MLKKICFSFLKLFLLWILIFDFQRVLFTIHNWDKFNEVPFKEVIQSFFYSFRLDISTAAGLNFLPILFLFIYYLFPKKIFKTTFLVIIFLEFLLVGMIHSGEINAYGEWNHKLTSRVFMHLSNPDEVFRSADYWMTFWFFVYLILEVVFSWKIMRFLFKNELFSHAPSSKIKGFLILPVYLFLIALAGGGSMLLLRGGFQQIPININSAIFSNKSVSNDLSMNPLYFFSKSFLLYNRSDIDDLMPEIDPKLAKKIVADLYDFPKKHDTYIFQKEKPNIVLVVMESWAAEAIGCLSKTKGATPNFDKLASEGVLFTNLYGTSHTSEIGNASIFSGFPAIPEISITKQPDKSRKISSINQSLKPLGYTSSYLFGGDLKYGNIGGFFMDHGFDVVKDESDFSGISERGKLNYYDKDVYDKFIDEINHSKEPFLNCVFTGSTHSPFDVPLTKGQNWKGNEAAYMNSLIYADQCLGAFIQKAKKQAWYKNTIFVFVADHSHSTPEVESPMESVFYRIPLLFWGPALKSEARGTKIEKLASQFDIPATLLYQLGVDSKAYKWSKDILNPHTPEFTFHTIIRGYGWRTPSGFLTYQMQMKQELENSFSKKDKAFEQQRCNAFITEIYNYYKEL